jgi:type I restriction enzyme R subunit
MNKRDLSERDICTKFITPALEQAGWDIMTQVREELTFTAGRVIIQHPKPKRGEPKRADFVLYHKPNIPIAVIEAKDNNHTVGAGMQQAVDYAGSLDVPFAFSSNGDGFLEHDRTVVEGTVERELGLESFPSPDELWRRYAASRGLAPAQETAFTQDYHVESAGKSPRYYQLTAINRAVQAIVRGQDRVLLVMATGTGKTYTAFQIIWRLWKARTKKRILFLADRNILVDQTRNNDFKPFGSAMTKIQRRQVDKSYEIYLALYQAVTGTEEEKNIYKQFSPDFFDLVVVDECHRGSAAEDSAWREVLEYFKSATQIGMTATPKETKYVSNIDYFGEPVFIYSLRQGIDDGFLAPYKVIRIDIDKDLLGWRPPEGKLDKYGIPVPDRVYDRRDMDRTLVLDKRTTLVAHRVTQFLKATDRYAKTIVFCEDIDHAERIRQALVNENADEVAKNDKYIMRITGDELVGKAELDNFIDPESRYPVVATTSKLLSTGVDAQTCKLIVLDQSIQSLSAFKQIIGRGTRINEAFGKYYFTIMDFKKATELFADPEFDGDPVQVYEPTPGGPPVEPADEDSDREPTPDDRQVQGHRVKYYVDDVPVYVMAERVQYIGKDGKPITESLKDYTRRQFLMEHESLDSFLKAWGEAEKKKAIVDELQARGVFIEELAAEVGRDYDPFDLICHVVFDRPPLTRRERADDVRKRDYFTRYGEKARAVLDALLNKYADAGVEQLDDMGILKVMPFDEIGTPVEIVSLFGGPDEYEMAIHRLEAGIYAAA